MKDRQLATFGLSDGFSVGDAATFVLAAGSGVGRTATFALSDGLSSLSVPFVRRPERGRLPVLHPSLFALVGN